MSESDNDDGYHELQPNSKCLFCAAVLPPNFTLVNGKVTPIKEENDLAPCFTAEGGILDKQLQVVFILRNILHITEGKLCKFLADFRGELNPQFWFQVCGVCGDAVRLFYDTLKEISKLKRRLDGVSNQLKTKVYVTKDEEGNAVIWKEIRGEILKGIEDGSEQVNVELAQEGDIQPIDDDHDDSDNGSEQWKPDENHSNSEIDEYQPPTKLRKRKLTKTSFPRSKKGLLPTDAPKFRVMSEAENGQECEADKSRKYEGKKKRKLVYFQCPECPARLVDNRRLLQHSEVHKLGAENVTTCPVCGWLLKNKSVNQHMVDRHSKKIILNSNPIQAKTVAATPQKFTFVGSNEEIPYYCDHCQMIFTTGFKLQFHFNGCHAESHGYLSCTQPGCELEFASKQLLNFHLKSAHPQSNAEDSDSQPAEQEQELKCKYCEQTFLTKNSVDFHIAKEHQADLLTCVPCNKKFKNYQSYRTHLETTKAHAGTKTYPCEFCGKEYSAVWLTIHKRQEHAAELGLQPISCQECGKIMSSRRALRDHMNGVHLKIKTLACEFCGKEFAAIQNLRWHVKRYHEGSQKVPVKERHFRLEKGENGEETWLCDFCPVQFPNLQSVRTHLLSSIHYDQLKYVCDGCNKRFCASLGLHQHRKSCTEVKTEQETQKQMFPCKFCSKEYDAQKQVWEHEKNAHKDRFTHKCQKCEKVFRTVTRLTNHTIICGGSSAELKGNQNI